MISCFMFWAIKYACFCFESRISQSQLFHTIDVIGGSKSPRWSNVSYKQKYFSILAMSLFAFVKPVSTIWFFFSTFSMSVTLKRTRTVPHQKANSPNLGVWLSTSQIEAVLWINTSIFQQDKRVAVANLAGAKCISNMAKTGAGLA